MTDFDFDIDPQPSLPTEQDVQVISRRRDKYGFNRFYKILTLPGQPEFPSVTTILEAYGGGGRGLQNWAARIEGEARDELAIELMAKHGVMGRITYHEEVKKAIGSKRAYIKELEKAGDIGTQVHELIRWKLKNEMGISVPKPAASDQALWGFMVFEDFWQDAGFTPFMVEQPVWHESEGYAGQLDLGAKNRRGAPGILDFKTGKGIYDNHHMQMAAYQGAVSHWWEPEWGAFIHLPKVYEKTSFTLTPLGHIYGRPPVTFVELFDAFLGVKRAWTAFMSTEAKS